MPTDRKPAKMWHCRCCLCTSRTRRYKNPKASRASALWSWASATAATDRHLPRRHRRFGGAELTQARCTRRRPPLAPAAAHHWHSAASHRMQRRVGPPQLPFWLPHRPLRVPPRTRAATRPHGAAVRTHGCAAVRQPFQMVRRCKAAPSTSFHHFTPCPPYASQGPEPQDAHNAEPAHRSPPRLSTTSRAAALCCALTSGVLALAASSLMTAAHQDADVIVFATGYKISFPFLSPDIAHKTQLDSSSNEIQALPKRFSPKASSRHVAWVQSGPQTLPLTRH